MLGADIQPAGLGARDVDRVAHERGTRLRLQPAGDVAFQVVEATARLGNLDENFPRILEQAFAGFGDNDRAREAIEQPLIHFRFQLLDLLTKRRLSDMFASSGAREAALFSYSNEVTELMNLHWKTWST